MNTELKEKLLDTDKTSIASLLSKNFLNEEATYELHEIVDIENTLNRHYLICKTGKKKKDKIYMVFKI